MSEGFVEEKPMGYMEYYKIAEKTGVFNKEELRSLDYILDQWMWKPDDEYSLVDIKDGDKIVGFAVFGKASFSKNCWDIYWIAIKPSKQKKGRGKKLLVAAEERILKDNKFAILRIETSSRDPYIPARKLYVSCDFKEGYIIKNYFDI